jgi:hypothetical protein
MRGKATRARLARVKTDIRDQAVRRLEYGSADDANVKNTQPDTPAPSS